MAKKKAGKKAKKKSVARVTKARKDQIISLHKAGYGARDIYDNLKGTGINIGQISRVCSKHDGLAVTPSLVNPDETASHLVGNDYLDKLRAGEVEELVAEEYVQLISMVTDQRYLAMIDSGLKLEELGLGSTLNRADKVGVVAATLEGVVIGDSENGWTPRSGFLINPPEELELLSLKEGKGFYNGKVVDVKRVLSTDFEIYLAEMERQGKEDALLEARDIVNSFGEGKPASSGTTTLGIADLARVLEKDMIESVEEERKISDEELEVLDKRNMADRSYALTSFKRCLLAKGGRESAGKVREEADLRVRKAVGTNQGHVLLSFLSSFLLCHKNH